MLYNQNIHDLALYKHVLKQLCLSSHRMGLRDLPLVGQYWELRSPTLWEPHNATTAADSGSGTGNGSLYATMQFATCEWRHEYVA